MEDAHLAAVPLFSDLSEDDRRRLLEQVREVEVSPGERLAEQGDLSYKFFVILGGTAAVHRSGRHVADLGPGDFFGEQGILDRARRNADVWATSPMTLAVLVGWDFRELIEEFPTIRYRIEDAVEAREGP